MSDAADTTLPPKSEIVGHRIVEILGDSSLSDSSFNWCSFVYRTDNGHAFRVPTGSTVWGDLWPLPEPGKNYELLEWDKARAEHYRENLWSATIVDILVAEEMELRGPDSGVILLSSGWCLCQCGGGAMGIAPCVDIVELEKLDDPMISLWD
jgi:hypothetical protein